MSIAQALARPSNGQHVNERAAPVKPMHERARSEVDLILERFRLRARRRAAWLQKLWAEEGEPGGKLAISHAEVATYLDDHDSPEAEAYWQSSNAQAITWTGEIDALEATLDSLELSRLKRIGQIFNLSTEDLDLLAAAFAVAIDPSLTRICAYLQDQAGRAYLTQDLAARLFGYGRSGAWNEQSMLFQFELVTLHESAPGEPRPIVCDPFVRDWMLGVQGVDRMLSGIATQVESHSPLGSWPLEKTLEDLVEALHERRAPVRLRIVGAKGSGRRTFAACLAESLGFPLLAIDADTIDDANWRKVFMHTQRQAFLGGGAIAWTGESLMRRPWPNGVEVFPVQFVIAESATEMPAAEGMLEWTVTIPIPSAEEREKLWLELVPHAAEWSAEAFHALNEQHRFLPGDIAAAGRGGKVGIDRGLALALESSRAKLGNLAQRIECPYTWDDFIVTPLLRENLKDLEFEARHRLTFWENSDANRFFSQGRGLIALLSGPPGTGKTMAAQVIAASLGYDLYRVNLSTVVSKWVGETSKNLESILSRAAAMDAILLFDEADALFSKRSTEVRDANDRFANTDSAHLLQAIEAYPGIAILTTNQKSSVDPAFLRRLRYVLEFPKPDFSEQELMWKQAVSGLIDKQCAEAIAPALKSISTTIDATGAQIKNAVLGAIFKAKRDRSTIAVEHLIDSLRRELQKEGRTIAQREQDKILSNAK